MRKLLALVLTLVMIFALTACGGDKNPIPSGGGTTDPGTSQQTEQNTPAPGTSQQTELNTPAPNTDEPDNSGDETSGGELFDIADTAIRAYAADLMTTLTGDEAAAMLAKIPTEIKKGVGELGKGLCTIAPSTSGSGYNFGVAFFVPKDSVVDYFTMLTDYYKTLDGTVTDETVIGDHHFFEMEFSWGKTYQCEFGAYNEDSAAIKVGFTIYE